SKDGVVLPMQPLALEPTLLFSPAVIYTLGVASDGKILIGGAFNEINGQLQMNVARVNAEGTLDTTFTPPPMDGAVRSLFVQKDGKVIVVGDFAHVGTFFRRPIARLDTNGHLDEGFALGPNRYSGIQASAMSANDTLFVATYHVSAAGVTNRSIY